MDTGLTSLTLKALDGLSARASVTAENIANAGTPGYRPWRLSFEETLRQAAAEGETAIRRVQPQMTREPAIKNGEQMRLDLELAAASTTALRYAALIEVLNRQMQIETIAVTGSN